MWLMALFNFEYSELKEQKWIILDFTAAAAVRQVVPETSDANYHNLAPCIQRETIAKWSDELVTDIKINYV